MTRKRFEEIKKMGFRGWVHLSEEEWQLFRLLLVGQAAFSDGQ